MRDFVVPKTDTKVLGKVELEYAFQLRARFDAPHVSKTPKGDFRYQDINSGDVRGERLTAAVYADSGGQYDTVRPDRVRDVDAHFILKAAKTAISAPSPISMRTPRARTTGSTTPLSW
jgi:hypothetical protein